MSGSYPIVRNINTIETSCKQTRNNWTASDYAGASCLLADVIHCRVLNARANLKSTRIMADRSSRQRNTTFLYIDWILNTERNCCTVYLRKNDGKARRIKVKCF